MFKGLQSKIIVPIFTILFVLVLLISFFSKNLLRDTLLLENVLSTNDHVLVQANDHLEVEDFASTVNSDTETDFSKFARSISTPSTARITIWNTDKTIVYSDLKSNIGYQADFHPELEKAINKAQPFYVFRKKDIDIPVQTRVGEFVDIYVPIIMDEKVVAIAQVHNVVNAIVQPVERQLNLIIYCLLGGAALLSAIIFFIFKLLIIKPIMLMECSARAMMKGDFDNKVSYKSCDELGNLAENFDRMRKQLKFSKEVIEKSNKLLEKSYNETLEKSKSLEKINKFMVGRELKMIELKKEIDELKKKNSGD